MKLKECVNDLKSKLYIEVQDYQHTKSKFDELCMKRDVLKEIVDIVENNDVRIINDNLFLLGMQLPIIYGEVEGNRIFDMIMETVFKQNASDNNLDNEIKNSKFKLLQSKLNDDCLSFINEIKLLESKLILRKSEIIEYRRILSNYKYNGLITPSQVDLLVNFMTKYNMDGKDQIRILESIRIHNIRVKDSDSKISYTVVNMLDNSYEKYEIDQLDELRNQNKFSTTIDSFCRTLKMGNSVEEVINLMPELDSGSYTLEEFDYIYKSIINNLIDELIDSITSISDSEIYNDIELRKVVIQEYNENRYRYNKIMDDYQSKRQNYFENLEQQFSNQKEEITNNLFYKLAAFGEISYLEKDIKDFPEEYFPKVRQLLEKKKNGKTTSDIDRSFNAHKQLKGYRELRVDQVRIIYKHLSQNNYLIVGAFVKKSDNDRKMYRTMVERGTDVDISTPELLQTQLENSIEVENRLYSMIDEKARKGSR